MATPTQSNRSNAGVRLLAVAIAYVVSRALFAALGFHYNVFGEPFDLSKFAVDFGVWILVFASTVWLLDRFESTRRRPI
jgi:hypothetical protein